MFDDDYGEGSVFIQTAEPAQAELDTTAEVTAESTPTADEAPTEAPTLTDEETQQIEEEAEKLLADERTPKFYRNYVKNVLQPNLAKAKQEVEIYAPLRDYGDIETIQKTLARSQKLGEWVTNPSTGLPELTTKNFVKEVYDEKPEIIGQMLKDSLSLPSPTRQGWNLIHDALHDLVGIDPTKLDAIREFAKNGYQLTNGDFPPPSADELEGIPDHLQGTFKQLSPEEREELSFLSENVRNSQLERARVALEQEQQQKLTAQTAEERQQQEQQKAQAEFQSAVSTRAEEIFLEAGGTLFSSFVESLAKSANLDAFEATTVANTIVATFNPNTFEGQHSLKALKEIGVEPDPLITTLVGQIDQNSRNIAYFEKTGDKASLERAVAQQVELKERLSAKTNKVIAAVTKYKANRSVAVNNDKNSLLAQTQTSRHELTTNDPKQAVGAVNRDYSDEAYLSLLG